MKLVLIGWCSAFAEWYLRATLEHERKQRGLRDEWRRVGSGGELPGKVGVQRRCWKGSSGGGAAELCGGDTSREGWDGVHSFQNKRQSHDGDAGGAHFGHHCHPRRSACECFWAEPGGSERAQE